MGKNKNVGCGCDYCMSRGIRRDFRHGAVDENDFEDEVPYYKGSRRKRKKSCPKSKTNEPCNFTVRIEKWSYTNSEGVKRGTDVMTCERCGRHGKYIFY